MYLKDLTSIYSGLSFRKRIIHNAEGDVGVIQLRNLVNDYSVIDSVLDRIIDDGIKSKYFLAAGDILLAAKGGNNHAVRVTSFPERAVATSSFFIIKIKHNKIDSGYLHWLLNHSHAQNELKKQQSGTYTPTLNISALQELEIPLPPMDKQVNIGKLYQLQLREKNLQTLIIEKRQILMDNMLIGTIQNAI